MEILMDLDRTVCMHCGACVGSCPENAMFLYETRLEFLENCINCRICERACPVGAIFHREKSPRVLATGPQTGAASV